MIDLQRLTFYVCRGEFWDTNDKSSAYYAVFHLSREMSNSKDLKTHAEGLLAYARTIATESQRVVVSFDPPFEIELPKGSLPRRFVPLTEEERTTFWQAYAEVGYV